MFLPDDETEVYSCGLLVHFFEHGRAYRVLCVCISITKYLVNINQQIKLLSMKRIFLILTIAFCCSNFLFSQIDDLTIAQKLIGKYKTEIDTILKSLNLEYYKTYEDRNNIIFYLAKGNESVRCWTLSLKI